MHCAPARPPEDRWGGVGGRNRSISCGIFFEVGRLGVLFGVLGGLFSLSFFVLFSCCFFGGFWVVLGCLLGSFLVSKIDQHEIL